MSWLGSLGPAVAAVVKIVLHDGWAALVTVWRRLLALIHVWCARGRRAGRESRITEQRCVPTREPAFRPNFRGAFRPSY